MNPDRLTPERIVELRRMTGQERLQEAEGLFWEARREKAATIHGEHPDFSEDEVQSEVNRIFLLEAMKES